MCPTSEQLKRQMVGWEWSEIYPLLNVYKKIWEYGKITMLKYFEWVNQLITNGTFQ